MLKSFFRKKLNAIIVSLLSAFAAHARFAAAGVIYDPRTRIYDPNWMHE